MIQYADNLKNQKLLLLTEGQLDLFKAKTACSLIRYRRGDVVGLVDSVSAGRTVGEVIGFGGRLPIHANVAAALARRPRPTALVIGIAPSGGRLPGPMRRHIVDALSGGLDVVSGLHTPLNADAELTALAAANGGRIHDVRQINMDLPVARMRALRYPVRRVLAVGTDCNCGKMVVTIELAAELRRRGLRAEFVPTGQTGIMIAGWGLAIDRTISDFTAGASEWLVGQVRDADFACVEGQGSLDHSGYAGVTLAQIHGTMPNWMVLCHEPGRQFHQSSPVRIKSLPAAIAMVETAAAWVRPSNPARVVAIALNTHRMDVRAARAAIDDARRQTGLIAFDPIRTGCKEPADRLIELAGDRRR